MPNAWTGEELDLLKKHYPHVDNKQLERMMHSRHPQCEIVRKANKLGLHKHCRADIWRARVQRLASRPGGMRAAELNEGEIGRRFISDMASRGELFKVVQSHRMVWYFATKELADKWRAPAAPTVKLKHPLSRATWSKDTPAYYPPGFKITQCPGPKLDHRTNGVWGIGGMSLIDSL